MLTEPRGTQRYSIEIGRYPSCNVSTCLVKKASCPDLYRFFLSHPEYFDTKLCWPGTVGTRNVNGIEDTIKVCFHNGPHVDLPGHLVKNPIAYRTWLEKLHQALSQQLFVHAIEQKDLPYLEPCSDQQPKSLYVHVDESDVTVGLHLFTNELISEMQKTNYHVITTNSLSVDLAKDDISQAQSNHFRLTQSGIIIVERVYPNKDYMRMKILTEASPNLDAAVVDCTFQLHP